MAWPDYFNYFQYLIADTTTSHMGVTISLPD